MDLKITIVLKRIDEDSKICDFLCYNLNSFIYFYSEIGVAPDSRTDSNGKAMVRTSKF